MCAGDEGNPAPCRTPQRTSQASPPRSPVGAATEKSCLPSRTAVLVRSGRLQGGPSVSEPGPRTGGLAALGVQAQEGQLSPLQVAPPLGLHRFLCKTRVVVTQLWG